MGMYCCCGIKKTGDWVCECDWDGWSLCYKFDNSPEDVPIKHPDKDGTYEVRTFDSGDSFEDISEFSLVEKNWGEPTNQAISHWKIAYDDHWLGFSSVYAWKEIK